MHFICTLYGSYHNIIHGHVQQAGVTTLLEYYCPGNISSGAVHSVQNIQTSSVQHPGKLCTRSCYRVCWTLSETRTATGASPADLGHSSSAMAQSNEGLELEHKAKTAFYELEPDMDPGTFALGLAMQDVCFDPVSQRMMGWQSVQTAHGILPKHVFIIKT